MLNHEKQDKRRIHQSGIVDFKAEAEAMRKDVLRHEMKLNVPAAHIEDRAKELLSYREGPITDKDFSGRTKALDFAVLFNKRPRYNELLNANEENMRETVGFRNF